MRDRFSSLPRVCGGILALLLASQAAPVCAESLYRVELMVFSYPAGSGSEQWEALPELSYPETARFLIDPRDHRGVPPQGGLAADPSSAADAGVTLAPATPSTAYVLLPGAERELGAGAASMQGSGRYRMLFHEAWIQPMPGRSAAVPIVLDHSGEGGAWPELQGTVTLYQAGDYVLETNLWLNTRGDYLPGSWRMPPPPRGPGPDVVPLAAELDATPSAQDSAGLAVELPAEGATDYPYRHAVLLQQTRRMRGGKAYYIDHPMLGVVAKVSPLDAVAAAPITGTVIPQQTGPAP